MRLWIICLCLVGNLWAADFYSVKERTIEGKDITMEQFKGQVVLIVNIASQCGYTPQLEKLEALHQKYKARNFVILGVPTNDFGGQTPEDDGAMKEFCQKKYQVTFPLLAKRTIKGKDKRALYQFLGGDVGWNFEKYLVNKTGEVVEHFKSSVEPMDKELTRKIESLL
jgi:glutathione peroxidase